MRAVVPGVVLAALVLSGCAAKAVPPVPAGADLAPGGPPMGWPALEDAAIRPGVRIPTVSPTGLECTANFVFGSPDNATLYIGTASHCLNGRSVGDAVAVGGLDDAGVVAYCSFQFVEGLDDCPPFSFPPTLHGQDFGLVRIAPAFRHLVHPAVLHWGGPTGVAWPPDANERVLMYGGTNLNPSPALAPMEGYVWTSSPGFTVAVTARPGMNGDSGSPTLTATGEAIGVAQRPELVDPPGGTHIRNLAPLLAFMEEQAGLVVELKTWALLEDGVLPPLG